MPFLYERLSVFRKMESTTLIVLRRYSFLLKTIFSRGRDWLDSYSCFKMFAGFARAVFIV